jgi:iron(III) transport system substrate-binding protein
MDSKRLFALGSALGFLLWLFPEPAVAAAPAKSSEWAGIVEAAKKEGRVVMMGPVGADVRDAFTLGFQKKYPEIRVDYSGMPGASVAPKLLAELRARRYITDLVVAGTTTALQSLQPVNAIVPMQPFLVGPESQDQSKWRGGKFHFSDNAGRYNLVYGMRVQVAFVANPEMVPQGKIKGWKDLLHPEWKGKIASLNPRRAGAGLDLATFWYTNEKLGLGKNFIKQLYGSQEIFFSNDERQLLDFVARGRYPIAIGPSGVLAFEFMSKGLPVTLVGSGSLQEGGFVTASNGTITVPYNAPRPNAAKLYLDYLLSREGQSAWSKASGLSSLRQDVPRDHIPDVLIPKEGVKYQENHTEPYVILRDDIVEFLDSVIPR